MCVVYVYLYVYVYVYGYIFICTNISICLYIYIYIIYLYLYVCLYLYLYLYVHLYLSILLSLYIQGLGQNLLLQNHKHVIPYHNNVTLKHTTWHFRWNVQIKTINYYTHIIALNHTQADRTSARPCIDNAKTWNKWNQI